MPADAARDVRLPARRADASTVAVDDNVAVYDDVGQLLILLNTSAAAVWERCDGVTTVETLVRELTATYPDVAADMAEDVRQTVDELRELGLVVDAGS